MLARFGVQSAGGLVGHDDGGMGGDGPGDGHPLLLTAGHFGGLVLPAVGHAYLFQGLHHDIPALQDRHTLIDQGQLHIFIGGEGGDQVIALEDEADLLVADVGQLAVRAVGDVLTVQGVVPIGGDVQTAQNVHQGGLARAGGADDSHELPPADGQGYAVQGADLALLAFIIYFVDVFDVNEHSTALYQ